MTTVRELSPRGSGAISVVRVAGPQAFRAVRTLAPRARLRPGAFELARLADEGDDLDEALVCTLASDEVELHLHGSRPLVARVIERLTRAIGGADAPSVGAETLEERAWRRLADAPSEVGARILLDQAEGALRRELEAWTGCTSAERLARIERLLTRSRAARRALEPASVVLAGPVNAGKSTLFNVLVGERRALVDASPGTTRDLVIERAQLGAWPVLLTDTAGNREVDARERTAAVERAGQERARRARESADLVLWLEPVGGERSAGARAKDAFPDVARAESTSAGKDTSGDELTDGRAEHDARLRPRVRPGDAADAGAPGRPLTVRLTTCADRIEGSDRASIEPAVSALTAPEHARALVVELFTSALELPPEPWSPGTPVLFDAEQVAAVEALRDLDGSQDLAWRIRRLLEPR